MRKRVALLVSAVLALAGCGGGAKSATPPARVYAAASLTGVLPRIDAGARYSFGGSDTLAAQIRQGAPADVFLSASLRYAAALHRDGLVDAPRVFAGNRLVVVVPRRDRTVRRLADLARPGVRLVLADPAVPAGDYARRSLARLHLDAALRNVVSSEPDVKGVVAKVALGEADAGIVYATDARAAGTKVRTIPIPARAQPLVQYAAAVVRSGRAAAARAFLARLFSPAGRRALRRAGFSVR